MDVLRTPDERFDGLPDFGYEPHYVTVGTPGGNDVRMAYVEAGPADGPVVLLLHGEPSWSFLYRTMLPVLAGRGLRAIAPDLVGFGRSDKPAQVADHSYARHVEWLRALAFEQLNLRQVTLVGQDWGGLLGLRLVAEHPDRFARVVAANTGLPTGDEPMPEVWWQFRRVVEKAPDLDVARLVQSGCQTRLPEAVRAGYAAPFPTAIIINDDAPAVPDLHVLTANDTAVDEGDAATLFKLIDTLDDDDDVQTVWGNYEVSDAVMEKLG